MNLTLTLRVFFELARRAYARQFTYRAATFAGLTTNFFFGILRVAVMMALYAGRPEVAGLTLYQAITFTGLSQAVIGFLSLFGWYEMMGAVYDGSVGSALLKPIGVYTYWLAQDAGRALAQLLLRGLPILAAYALVVGISVPDGALQWLALGVSLVLGWLVSFSWRFLVNLSAFWVPNAQSIGRFFFGLSYFLSGFVIPLRFMPEWFVTLCQATPFPHSVNTILEVYLGVLQGPALLQALAMQAAWALGLMLAGQLVLALGIRRLTIGGG